MNFRFSIADFRFAKNLKNLMYKTLLKQFLNSSSENLKSKIQNRKWAGLFAIVVAFTMCGVRVEAQQPKRVSRRGYLTDLDAATEFTRAQAIRLALRERGHIEGQHITTEYRYMEGKRDRAPDLLAELLRLKVDIIVVTAGRGTIQAAKNATKTISVVMAAKGPILSHLA